MPAPRGRSETRQTPPGARPNRRAQPRFAGGRGALPSPRVGRTSRRATAGPACSGIIALRRRVMNWMSSLSCWLMQISEEPYGRKLRQQVKPSRQKNKKAKPDKNPTSPFKKNWRQPTLAEPIEPLPSARLCLTAVFGMGTGRTTALWPPKNDLESRV